MDEKLAFNDSKTPFHQSRSSLDDLERPQSACYPSSLQYRDRTLRRLCIAICILLVTWTFSRSLLHSSFITSSQLLDQQRIIFKDGLPQITDHGNKTRNVSLEAHVMSKCPDAKACLRGLVVPAMQNISDKVDFQLSFIGSVDPHSDAVSCKHGPSECLGNMIILCASHLYPDPKLSLGFARCLIDDYHDIPQRDLVESCAMEHGLDFNKINSCISEEGKAQQMLRESVERSVDAGVNVSCTIRLERKVWCMTDEKKDCNDAGNLDDLVKDINKAYEELNP